MNNRIPIIIDEVDTAAQFSLIDTKRFLVELRNKNKVEIAGKGKSTRYKLK